MFVRLANGWFVLYLGPLVRPPALLYFGGTSAEERRYHSFLVSSSSLLPYVRYGDPSSHSLV